MKQSKENISKRFDITKQRCAKMICGVCRRCGHTLEPILTENNSGIPTYWAGCPECMVFDWGVDPKIFEIARKLVDERNYIHYHHLEKGDSDWDKNYWRKSQIGGATRIVMDVLNIAQGLSA